jgi:CRP/FNR family transcriptional regulator, cyclic AMP receptor protein
MTYSPGADWLGYVAAMLVFCSFYAKTIVMLRFVAIASNMAFIGYGFAKGLYPVLILHVVLLPLNCVRLVQLRAMSKRPERENDD